MDICKPCEGHDIYASGLMYFHPWGYFYLPCIFSLRILKHFGVKLVVCPGAELKFCVLDRHKRDITMDAHSISSASVLFQVEHVFCEGCPYPTWDTNLADMDIDEMRIGTEEDLEELLNGYNDEFDNVNVTESKSCTKKEDNIFLCTYKLNKYKNL